MIAAQTLFGLNMAQRRARRIFVLGYCALLLVFLALGTVWNRGFLFCGAFQSVLLAGVLGGIRGGGPVKPFSGRQREPGDFTVTTASFPVQALNLEQRLPTAAQLVRLDERERSERDEAHFTAFRLLRYLAGPLCLVLILLLYDLPKVATRIGPAILWTVLMLILSLPQLVILWSEPDAID